MGWTDLSLDEYNPRVVRSRLPVEWIVGELWSAWGAAEGMIPCPLHDDDTPSFNLWAPDKDGIPQKWGCFGCGQRGDAIDVIQYHHGCGYFEALNLAVEKYIPAFKETGFEGRQVPEQLAVDIQYAWNHMSPPDDLVVKGFCEEKGIGTAWEYVVKEWLWRGTKTTSGGTVSMPHIDANGIMTGVKQRNAQGKGKWSIYGSRYPELYGAWRAQDRRRVIICEGETDTVWAAYSLRDTGCDVLGLAAGAHQAPVVEALGDRKVWLLFDGDDAGRAATARWKEALPHAKTVHLPDGEDLISSGMPVRTLLAMEAI